MNYIRPLQVVSGQGFPQDRYIVWDAGGQVLSLLHSSCQTLNHKVQTTISIVEPYACDIQTL